jgi:putative selenate reductase
MPDLVPYPFAALTRHMFREFEETGSIFHLPQKKFFRGDPELDLSVDLHGRRVSSPLGPAAGPQTQMAQNMVLSWLGGSRIMELKTVQNQDQLHIPRPCIDVHTVGLNAEWSQELEVHESLEEYVKGAMLIEMLRSGPVKPLQGFGRMAIDMSLGYDLYSMRSFKVQDFVKGLQDASETVDRLRAQIPDNFAHLRDLDYPTHLSNTLTLSTFHGCPPHEIERIMDFLMRDLGLHSIVKLNPMLLGYEETHRLLHDELGYTDLNAPKSAFERDTTWKQAVDFVGRLGDTAAELGVGFGVKFSNTLIVENTRGFLAPGLEEVYLSGEPLHVLAIRLVQRFRRVFGDRFPISFAAGIDAKNFPDAVALGLVPITVSTDLLRKGGYGRLAGYYAELRRRMQAASATDLDEFVLNTYGKALQALEGVGADDETLGRCRTAVAEGGNLRAAAGDKLFERWVSAAKLLNTEHYGDRVVEDPRYTREATSNPPRKIGSHLELFDCVTCDICVPVCPNDANFTFGSEQRQIPVAKVEKVDGGWSWRHEDPIDLERRHQIGNFYDFCNDCGNCDIFCPEDGGPYVMKPRFFGSEQTWRQSRHLDGFYLERREEGDRVLGRFGRREFDLSVRPDRSSFTGPGFELQMDLDDLEETLTGEASAEVDLTYCYLMDYLRRAILDSGVNYVQSLSAPESGGGQPVQADGDSS